MNTDTGRYAPTDSERRQARRHTHTQHQDRLQRLLARDARSDIRQAVAAL